MAPQIIFAVLLALSINAAPALADYNVTIGSGPSSNGSWSAGTWTPSGSGANVNAAEVQAALASGNVTITTSGGGSENGDITLSSALTWAANTLTLNASRNVQINVVMTASGSSALAMNAAADDKVLCGFGLGGAHAGRVDFFQADGTTPRSGTGFLTINGSGYTVITSLGTATSSNDGTLQGIQGNLSGNYALGANIDASPASGWNSGTGFMPLGNMSVFTGRFDGLGHTISNLWTRSSNGYAGLFSSTIGAVLRNLGLVSVNVMASGSLSPVNNSGGLAGFTGGGSITNSYVTGAVSSSGSGSFAPSNYSGGLVGGNSGSITNSYATGAVVSAGSSGNYSGGLVADNAGSITNSYATGAVVTAGSSNYSGGLVADNSGSITNSYATGVVSAGGNSGGLVGGNRGSITNSYATGAVFGRGSTFNYSGGLVGYGVVALNSFWDIQTSGMAASSSGTGLTTAQMKSAAAFMSAGWDPGVWKFQDGLSYPLLKVFMTPLTVTANSATVYSDQLPYGGSGGIGYSPANPDATHLFGTGTYTSPPSGSASGSYSTTPGGFWSDQQGYDITFASGTLTVSTSLLQMCESNYTAALSQVVACNSSLATCTSDKIQLQATCPAQKAVLSVAFDGGTNLYAAVNGQGVYKSTDNGVSWNVANGATPNNLTNLNARVVVIDKSDSTKLYAATYGGGVFRSTDSGATWSGCPTQPDNGSTAGLKIASLMQDASGRLYAGTDGGVFVSSDNCSSWNAVNTGLPN